MLLKKGFLSILLIIEISFASDEENSDEEILKKIQMEKILIMKKMLMEKFMFFTEHPWETASGSGFI